MKVRLQKYLRDLLCYGTVSFYCWQIENYKKRWQIENYKKRLTNESVNVTVLQESEKKNAMMGNSKLGLLFSERCRLV